MTSQRDYIRQYFKEYDKGTSAQICDYLIKHNVQFRVAKLMDKRKSVSGNLSKMYKHGKGELGRGETRGREGYIYYKK